jgi:hypothetical protein
LQWVRFGSQNEVRLHRRPSSSPDHRLAGRGNSFLADRIALVVVALRARQREGEHRFAEDSATWFDRPKVLFDQDTG